MTILKPDEYAIDEETLRSRKQAELIADALFDRVYTEIGRSIFKKIIWIGVAVIVVVAMKFHLLEIPGLKG